MCNSSLDILGIFPSGLLAIRISIFLRELQEVNLELLHHRTQFSLYLNHF